MKILNNITVSVNFGENVFREWTIGVVRNYELTKKGALRALKNDGFEYENVNIISVQHNHIIT